nr:ankyrin repeat domain-containing protein [Actinomycetota bacterium]
DVIQALVALGADPNGRSSFGGPDHGRDLTPLHLAAQGGRLEAIAVLLELGADSSATDGLYDSTAEGWAQEFGQADAVALLRASL